MSEAIVSLADKLAAKREQLGTNPPVAPVPPVLPTPQVTFMADERSANDEVIDSAVDGLDIIDAYNMYARKGSISGHGKRTEGIKCSCPNPLHPDAHPSAWINTDKQTWFCGGCNEGGDKYDIAAWFFGMPVPGYKVGKSFHDLRRKIAESRGFIFQKQISGLDVVVAPYTAEFGPDGAIRESTPIAVPDGLAAPGKLLHIVTTQPGDDTAAATVTAVPAVLSRLEEIEDIELDWRAIVPAGSFLDVWMKQTVIDDVPEEYHFWNGLLAISMSLGRDVTLQDFRPVYGNLFVCILGRTGSGKSKSKYYLDQLLELALPYKATDPFSKGVLRIGSLASAEALIWSFKKEIEDPSKPKGSAPDLFPVRGLVDYSELSSLVGRTQRSGNVLVPTLMQFYDMEGTVETVSRTHGVERAEQPYACAITTSQPKALRGLLTVTDAASGFLNRWFFAAGKEKKRAAIGGVVVNVTPAVKPLKDIQGWASSAGSLEWSQDANDKFTAFFYGELQPMMRKDETDLLNRMDLLCKKLILLFTANMKDRRVEVESVDQMIKMYPYLLECWGVPGAQVGSTLQNEIREAILMVVIDHQSKTGKGASVRDMTRRLARRNYQLDIFNRTLKYMQEIEEIMPWAPEKPTAGRPSQRFCVPDLEDAKAILNINRSRRESSEAKAK